MATENLMSSASSASSEKPDFPTVVGEEDTEMCDLLLTLDDVQMYSDDFVEGEPPKTMTRQTDSGEKIAEGKLYVIQYKMPNTEKGTTLTTSTATATATDSINDYGAFLNCDSLNLPIVSAQWFGPKAFRINLGGSVFRIYLDDSSSDDLTESFAAILHHYSVKHGVSYTEYESSTSIDQVKKSEQEPAKESADNEIAAAKDKSAQLAQKPTQSQLSKKWSARLVYKASETLDSAAQYAKSTIDYYGGGSSDSVKTYLDAKKEEVVPRGDYKVGILPRFTLGAAKFASGTGVRVTRGVLWTMTVVTKTAGSTIAGSRFGNWLATGEEGGNRHALKTLIETGLLAYGEIYTAIGNHGTSLMAASTTGVQEVATKMYGAEAAQSARTVGSISKDLLEMAWNINSMGLKTPVTAFGKGLFKGSI